MLLVDVADAYNDYLVAMLVVEGVEKDVWFSKFSVYFTKLDFSPRVQ